MAVNPRGQFQQRQGIPARLGDDPVADALIQPKPHRGGQHRASVAVAQTADLETGNVLKLLARFSRREHDPNRLRKQAPSDKRQRQRRRLIKPLRVIHNTQQRTRISHLRDQAQHP